MGFVLAFLLCGVISYFVLERIQEETKEQKEPFNKYKSRTSI